MLPLRPTLSFFVQSTLIDALTDSRLEKDVGCNCISAREVRPAAAGKHNMRHMCQLAGFGVLRVLGESRAGSDRCAMAHAQGTKLFAPANLRGLVAVCSAYATVGFCVAIARRHG